MQRGEDEDKAENEAKTLAAKEEGNTVERLDAIHFAIVSSSSKEYGGGGGSEGGRG